MIRNGIKYTRVLIRSLVKLSGCTRLKAIRWLTMALARMTDMLYTITMKKCGITVRLYEQHGWIAEHGSTL